MTSPQCDGIEKHSHYMLFSGTTFLHTHKHTPTTQEFNRLHHHAPIEHENCTTEELENEAEIIKTPF